MVEVLSAAEGLASPGSNVTTINNNNSDDNVPAVTQQQQETMRQVAELAAAAAHRKNLDQDFVRERLMRTPSRKLIRHTSSTARGGAAVSGSGGLASGGGGGSSGSGFDRTALLHRTGSLRGLRRTDSSSRSSSSVGLLTGGPRVGGSGGGGLSRTDSLTRGVMTRSRSSLSRSDSNRQVGGGGGGGSGSSLSRQDSGRQLPSRRGVNRTSSSRSLKHMAGPPMTQLLAAAAASQHSTTTSLGLRSADDRSVGDLSAFTVATADSVNLRKQQIVADPVEADHDDDATYQSHMVESHADHESILTMNTHESSDAHYGILTEFRPHIDPNHIPYDGVSLADTVTTMDSNAYGTSAGGGGRFLHSNHATAAWFDSSQHSHPDNIAVDNMSLGDYSNLDDFEIPEESDDFAEDNDINILHEEPEEESDDDDDDDEDDQPRATITPQNE